MVTGHWSDTSKHCGDRMGMGDPAALRPREVRVCMCMHMRAFLYIYSLRALINLRYRHIIFALHRATNAVYSALLTALPRVY